MRSHSLRSPRMGGGAVDRHTPFLPRAEGKGERTEGVRTSRSPRRNAFTLVEMMVALAVLVVLLVVMFVPLNMSSDLANIGQARANTQVAADAALDQMTGELQRAIVVFPNDHLPGVTTLAPYNANAGQNGYDFPFLRDALGYTSGPGGGAQNVNACRTGVDPNNPAHPALVAAGNTARIDFLLPATSAGALDVRLQPENTLVSYYCRRRDISKPFDPIENPIALFRAQMPYRQYLQAKDGSIGLAPFMAPDQNGAVNLRLTNDRFARRATLCATQSATVSRELRWMTQNQFGEFDLSSLCQNPPLSGDAPPTFASHALVLPRDIAVIAPNATTQITPTTSFVPDSTFLCRDTNADGKIDVVELQLNVGQYDRNYAVRRDQGALNAVPVPQVSRTLSAVVRCINVQ